MNFEGVIEENLSCLQLICSAHPTTVTKGKVQRITRLEAASLQETISRAAFLSHKDCL